MSTTRKLKRSMIHYADKKGYIRKWISAKRFNILYVLSIGILLAFMALFVFGCADSDAINKIMLLKKGDVFPGEYLQAKASYVLLAEDNGNIRKYQIIVRLDAENWQTYFVTCSQRDTVLSIWKK